MHLINISSYNHGKKNDSPYGYVSPMFSTRWTMCYHITILGPFHASNSSHTKHHEAKDMSTMKNINQVHPIQNVCSSCTTPMYINIMQCAKRYHPWNVIIICLYQHANMCIYQYANHVHPPICQPCASTNMPNNVSYHSWYVSIMNQVPQSCISNKCQLLC